MEALTNYMKDQTDIKKVYLINQDYSFGQAVRSRRQAMLKAQAARHPDRRRRTASAAEDHRLLALRRQDQGVRRRHRDHRQLGPGHRAAAEGAADAGLQVNWYTYYAGGTGGPTAVKQAGLNHQVFADRAKASPTSTIEAVAGVREGVPREVRRRALFYPRAVNQMRMLGGGRRQGQVDRSGQGRAGARRHEVRRLQRRRGHHAQGRPPVLPADVHLLVRRSRPARNRSTRKRPAGAGS